MSEGTLKPFHLPDQISENELNLAKKMVLISAQESWSSLSSDLELMSSLYYPVRQVPLPGFQAEMLLWQNDKLNVFGDCKSKLKFENLTMDEKPTLQNEVVKYKRIDLYTVLALISWGDIGVIFTNEVSQVSWEIIGVFMLRNLARDILPNSPSLVDYDSIETSFSKNEELKNNSADQEANDSDDQYWDRYGASSDGEHSSKNGENHETDDENSYWNKLSNQSRQIDDEEEENLGTKEYVVQAIVNLAYLYKDCGVSRMHTFVEDIEYIGLNGEAPSVEVPEIPHKHAKRTIQSLQIGNPSIKLQIAAALMTVKSNKNLFA